MIRHFHSSFILAASLPLAAVLFTGCEDDATEGAEVAVADRTPAAQPASAVSADEPRRPATRRAPEERVLDTGQSLSEHPEWFTPRQPPAPHRVTGGPAIFFETLDHDFGPMSNAETRSVGFPFVNTGDETLIIEGLSAKCGCTVPTVQKREYAPGERGVIHVDFTPRAGGWQAKSATVATNAVEPSELVNIRVISDVEAVLSFEPRSIDMGEVELGEETTKQVTLTADAPNTSFHSVIAMQRDRTQPSMVSASFVGDPPLKDEAELLVTLKDEASWGVLRNGAIQVETRGKLENGDEISKNIYIRVNAVVVDEIRADEYFFRMGQIPWSGPFRGEVIVYHKDHEPFEIRNLRVEPLDPSFAYVNDAEYLVEMEPNDGPKGGYKLILSGRSGPEKGFLSGSILFETVVEGGEPKERKLGINARVIDPNNPPRPLPSRS